ncbi:hypothetical protein [Thalassospira sp.]|uniref:hypothetical protein n=1 Tax=Thalassospira sp. TaxID=1912094 RepID=UPI0027356D4A|nr:hypothetical protein [Thalassospira sp.]MDP2699197.1 hypothetical protein [Thalassospira sp.]
MSRQDFNVFLLIFFGFLLGGMAGILLSPYFSDIQLDSSIGTAIGAALGAAITVGGAFWINRNESITRRMATWESSSDAINALAERYASLFERFKEQRLCMISINSLSEWVCKAKEEGLNIPYQGPTAFALLVEMKKKTENLHKELSEFREDIFHVADGLPMEFPASVKLSLRLLGRELPVEGFNEVLTWFPDLRNVLGEKGDTAFTVAAGLMWSAQPSERIMSNIGSDLVQIVNGIDANKFSYTKRS